jgi:peptidoglycan/LPS O-acetylase OafA/YrhL
MVIDTTQQRQQPQKTMASSRWARPVTRYSLLASGFCGFVTVFGLAHLLLIHITKPSGYIFFGTLAVVPLIGLGLLCSFARNRRAELARFGFGALMCACAIPIIYLARFAPESARPTVRNLLGLPFLILALIGPAIFARRNVRASSEAA